MMYNARINREFHAASWHEPIIFQLGSEGERGITIPKTPASIVEKVGGVTQALPESVRRKILLACLKWHSPRLYATICAFPRCAWAMI